MEMRFELLKLQFDALRIEIIEKMRFSHQLGYYKLLALGAILGITLAKGVDPRYESGLFLAVLLLPIVFDAALYFNGKAIVTVGTYVRRYIEPALKSCAHLSSNFHLWEEYISSELPSMRISSRLWWNLFEAIQPSITLVLQIIIFGYLYRSQAAIWLLLVAGLAVLLEIVFLVLAVRRK